MSEPHPSEDKAAQFLLGELTDTERRDFETELANSAELRALLRELEESSVLLAMASPQRRPPAKVWQSIEKIVADDAKVEEPISAFWNAQAWHGWAAAAAILLGWLLYALWTNHPNSSEISQSTTAETASAGNAGPNAHTPANNVENSSPNKTPATPRLASTDSPELLRLRRQVTELQNRVTNLSQSVAQQQALLGESNRIKFFQLASAPGNPGAASVPSLSPALQRALFIAMARELGWLPSADASFPGTNAAFAPGGNVDFVDLRPATNGPPRIIPSQPGTQAATRPSPDTSPAPGSAPIAIPAFTSGNNLVVAIDPSIVPAGTQVNFFDQNQQPIGWTTVGDNPVVVTVPTSIGGGVYLTTGGAGAPWNVFQILNPGPANP